MSLTRHVMRFAIAASCALVSVAVSAHAVLIDSNPKLHGTLPAGPVKLMFKYNSKVDQHRSMLTLVKPDHSEVTLSINTSAPANELDSSAELAPGQYTIRWQALALDGHLTRGDVPFMVGARP